MKIRGLLKYIISPSRLGPGTIIILTQCHSTSSKTRRFHWAFLNQIPYTSNQLCVTNRFHKIQPLFTTNPPKLLNRSLYIAFIIGSKRHTGCHVLGRLAVIRGSFAVGSRLDMKKMRTGYHLREIVKRGVFALPRCLLNGPLLNIREFVESYEFRIVVHSFVHLESGDEELAQL